MKIALISGAAVLAISGIFFIILALQSEPNPEMWNDPRGLFELAHRLDNPVHPGGVPVDRPVLVSGNAGVHLMQYDSFGIPDGPYMLIKRDVEYYAWVETEKTKEEMPKEVRFIGDRYKYHKAWLKEPKPWKSFKNWVNHKYVLPSLRDEIFMPTVVSIGRLEIDFESASFPNIEALDLVKEAKRTASIDKFPHDDKYIYGRAETISNPEPGDYRMSYQVLRRDKIAGTELTVLGKLAENRIIPFTDNTGRKHLYVVTGKPDDLAELLGPIPSPLYLAGPDDRVFLILGLSQMLLSLAILALYVFLGRRKTANSNKA